MNGNQRYFQAKKGQIEEDLRGLLIFR